MSVFKKFSKIAVKTALIGAFSLSSGGPIVAAVAVPLAICGFVREEFTERRNTVLVDEEFFQRSLEEIKEVKKEIADLKELKEDVDHLYELI